MSDLEYEINGVSYRVTVKEVSGDRAVVEVNGVDYTVMIKGRKTARAGNPEPAATVSAAVPFSEARPLVVRQKPSIDRKNHEGHVILAPISGVLLKVLVKHGDAVRAGDVVAVIEAMKMENNITAVRDGEVKEIKVQPGSEVQEGEVIIVMSE